MISVLTVHLARILQIDAVCCDGADFSGTLGTLGGEEKWPMSAF